MRRNRNVVLAMIIALLAILATEKASADELELGYNMTKGTYSLSVQIQGVGMRNLTFDTGASYTVLDKDDAVRAGARLEQSPILLILPHEGKAKPATFAIIPRMQIGTCVLLNRRIVVLDLPKGRQGAFGMADLEELAPFTFLPNGRLKYTCPTRK